VKYRNRDGNQQTSADFDGRTADLRTRVSERHFNVSSRWHAEGQARNVIYCRIRPYLRSRRRRGPWGGPGRHAPPWCPRPATDQSGSPGYVTGAARGPSFSATRLSRSRPLRLGRPCGPSLRDRLRRTWTQRPLARGRRLSTKTEETSNPGAASVHCPHVKGPFRSWKGPCCERACCQRGRVPVAQAQVQADAERATVRYQEPPARFSAARIRKKAAHP
jgi:hypothetical protein